AQAEQQGYEKGLEAAQEELNDFRNAMADSVSAVLRTLQEQGPHIFEQWREDVVGVVRLAVQRAIAKEISEHRKEVLEGLVVEAVGLLEKRRELVVRVNPDDEPVINDIISLTRDRFDDVRSWRVKSDSSITPGGMVVESESSLAEGRLEARIAAVDEVLERLTLPQNPDAEVEEQVQTAPPPAAATVASQPAAAVAPQPDEPPQSVVPQQPAGAVVPSSQQPE
ncbi:flagellar assembly protein FliH, partial [Desulfovibrio sp. OttesenSCG-928-G15]|nr:flagellar assembly protein FliH [Desulfovibrio sp. OttesenSCG-928-G15]